MDRRGYRLGKRQAGAERTRAAILAAARDLMIAAGSPGPSVVTVARRAGVSRLTVYQHFGSRQALIDALAGQALIGLERPNAPDEPVDGRDRLRSRISAACSLWASDPALFRRLPSIEASAKDAVAEERALAERLAACDQLRPGCSLREAEDVIAMLTSFPSFDRLSRDGRRSASAVGEILMRLAASILA